MSPADQREAAEDLRAAPHYAGVGDYPLPETEHGKALSSRLAVHGLDYNRSIWNTEQEARAALAVPAPRLIIGPECPVCGLTPFEHHAKPEAAPRGEPPIDVETLRTAFLKVDRFEMWSTGEPGFWEGVIAEYARLRSHATGEND